MARLERLDKVLAKHGFGTRKDVKRLVHSGEVTVNGEVCRVQDMHIDIDSASVCVSGEAVPLQSSLYIMMNKCAGVVSAAKDGLHQTVFDLLDDSVRHSFLDGSLHLVGRLDLDTEGLLLFTTDGEMTHRLTSPKTHISKTYSVTLRDAVSAERQTEICALFKEGIEVGPDAQEAAFKTQPAELSWVDETHASLIIYEGKYHQVKRMFAAVENEVIYLKRTAMGGLKLDESLEPGQYRMLSSEELNLLR